MSAQGDRPRLARRRSRIPLRAHAFPVQNRHSVVSGVCDHRGPERPVIEHLGGQKYADEKREQHRLRSVHDGEQDGGNQDRSNLAPVQQRIQYQAAIYDFFDDGDKKGDHENT